MRLLNEKEITNQETALITMEMSVRSGSLFPFSLSHDFLLQKERYSFFFHSLSSIVLESRKILSSLA